MDSILGTLIDFLQSEWISPVGAAASIVALSLSFLTFCRVRSIKKTVQEDRQILLHLANNCEAYEELCLLENIQHQANRKLDRVRNQIHRLLSLGYGLNLTESVGSIRTEIAFEVLRRGDVEGAKELYFAAIDSMVHQKKEAREKQRGEPAFYDSHLTDCLKGYQECCIILGERSKAVNILYCFEELKNISSYRTANELKSTPKFVRDVIKHWLGHGIKLVCLGLNPYRNKRLQVTSRK